MLIFACAGARVHVSLLAQELVLIIQCAGPRVDNSIHQEFVSINECAGIRHLATGFVGARVDIFIAQEGDNLQQVL